MIGLLIAAALQAGTAAPAAVSPVESVRVRGSDLERAAGEFRALCLAKPFDRAAFDAAAAASDWKYEHPAPRFAFADEWRSAHAFVQFNTEQAAARGLALPQCNFLAAASKKVGAVAIVAAIDSALRRAGIVGARFARDGEQMVWSWTRPDGLAQLHLIDPGADGQVISLSLQFWTPEWLARAPALVEEAKRRGLAYPMSNKTKE